MSLGLTLVIMTDESEFLEEEGKVDIKHNGQWKIAEKVHTFFWNLVYILVFNSLSLSRHIQPSSTTVKYITYFVSVVIYAPSQPSTCNR